MSDPANDAWNDWLRNRPIAPSQREVADHFYRRALEDAAKDLAFWWDGGSGTDRGIPIERSERALIEWLKSRADGVGTKDGDDEIEVPCLSCNDDPNVDCPVGCGRR